jgi:hypothetical protein
VKTWHVVLIVGAVAGLGIILLMSQQAKATTANSSKGTSAFSAQGLAALVGVGLSVYDRFGGSDTPKNEGTYQTGFVPIQKGNTLEDPNTGRTLVYGTD